jgi:hypothetical protein
MSSTLLVSAKKVKSFTEVNENVDEILLLANIQIAQDLGLQGLLGTRFFTHILDAAKNSTLTAPELTLLQDYIQPYLLWRATWEALPTLYMRVMNKSVIVGSTEQGNPVGTKDLNYLRNIHENRYSFYAQRMMDYIQNHPSDYPLYFQYTSTDGMPPSKENYYAGLHIEPGKRRLPKVGTAGGYGFLPSYTDPTDPDYCCYGF